MAIFDQHFEKYLRKFNNFGRMYLVDIKYGDHV